jgi:hypothetical protein
MELDPGSATGRIDPATLVATLNGANVASQVQLDNASLSFTPREPLANREHRFCAAVRNTAGNISPLACAQVTVSLPPARMDLAPRFPAIPPDGMSRTPLDLAVQDARMQAVIDGTPIRLSASGGTLMPAEPTTRQGRARVVLIADEQERDVVIRARAGDIGAQCRVAFRKPSVALLAASVRDPDGAVLEGVRLVRSGVVADTSDGGGWVYDSTETAEPVSYTLEKAGYHPHHVTVVPEAGTMNGINAVLDRIDGGILFNRRIVLDAAGDAATALALLQRLQDMLIRAGAAVALTWRPPATAPSERQRVALAQRMGADMFLSVRVGRGRPAAGYYPASVQGNLLAGLLAEHLHGRGPFRRRPLRREHSSEYVIVHTSMPAVRLRCPDLAPEDIDPVAEGLYAALKDYFGPAATRYTSRSRQQPR